jgi:hypothetical protein
MLLLHEERGLGGSEDLLQDASTQLLQDCRWQTADRCTLTATRSRRSTVVSIWTFNPHVNCLSRTRLCDRILPSKNPRRHDA